MRTSGNNYQIDGADNNDAFQNIAAVNQGGVSGIAGTLLPIEAIDQFSVQSGGSAEMGRNAGSTVNQTQALPVLPLTSNVPPAGWTLPKIPAGSVSAGTVPCATASRPAEVSSTTGYSPEL